MWKRSAVIGMIVFGLLLVMGVPAGMAATRTDSFTGGVAQATYQPPEPTIVVTVITGPTAAPAPGPTPTPATLPLSTLVIIGLLIIIGIGIIVGGMALIGKRN